MLGFFFVEVGVVVDDVSALELLSGGVVIDVDMDAGGVDLEIDVKRIATGAHSLWERDLDAAEFAHLVGWVGFKRLAIDIGGWLSDVFQGDVLIDRNVKEFSAVFADAEGLLDVGLLTDDPVFLDEVVADLGAVFALTADAEGTWAEVVDEVGESTDGRLFAFAIVLLLAIVVRKRDALLGIS